MITDEDDIKRMVKATIVPADLASAVEMGDKKIVSVTNRPLTAWSDNDPAYGQLQQIGALYGAWSILIGWNATEYIEKAKEIWKALLFEIESFRSLPLPESQADPNIANNIAESSYTIHVLNQNVPNYLSDY